jgi:hypothetical protein
MVYGSSKKARIQGPVRKVVISPIFGSKPVNSHETLGLPVHFQIRPPEILSFRLIPINMAR